MAKKQKKPHDEFDVQPFDEEEQELMESIERGEWVSTMTPETKAELETTARNTLLNNKRILLWPSSITAVFTTKVLWHKTASSGF